MHIVNTKYPVYTDYHHRDQTKMQRLTYNTMRPWTRKVMVTSEGYNSVKVVKVYKPTQCQVWPWYHLKELKYKGKPTIPCDLEQEKSRSMSHWSEGHKSVEVIKFYKPTKREVWTGHRNKEQT